MYLGIVVIAAYVLGLNWQQHCRSGQALERSLTIGSYLLAMGMIGLILWWIFARDQTVWALELVGIVSGLLTAGGLGMSGVNVLRALPDPFDSRTRSS